MERAPAAARSLGSTQQPGMASLLQGVTVRPAARAPRRGLVCTSGMGIGFTHSEISGLAVPSRARVEPNPEFGLTAKQMQVLGMGNEAMTKLPEVEAVSLGETEH